MENYHKVLSIAGSDSGGGAGIQADLKAISACGGYGMTAITALTAQNTQGVRDIHPVPIAHLRQQIEAVLDDIGVDAVKIGMLHSAEVIETVADCLEAYQVEKIVLDPVMVASSGDRLLRADAIATLKARLLPLAGIITPNLPEGAILLDDGIETAEELSQAARALGQTYGVSVLLKGGHLTQGPMVDVFYGKVSEQLRKLPVKRVLTDNTHGTGCTLSAAIATYWARGESLLGAVKKGQAYLQAALKAGAAYRLGKGRGPVHHFWALDGKV